ncbi:hypothetical protein [Myxococcus sp. CA039A]|uniref:hypothetical protein n=1 Tax=Myxococcus sp. CA039A TaxID=2741737 RepID=UPI00157A7B31|nr:hypothetical protein [Myxococcus sp. CA039A]NTX54871.1 hypothetical protein [Myxococcus sp. CA039A]
MRSYIVDIPAHLHPAYWRLPNEVRMTVALHLVTLAEQAPMTHDSNDGGPTRSDIGGLNAGHHHLLLGGLWFSYCISPQENLLRLLDFGDAKMTSRSTPASTLSHWRYHLPDQDVWTNEGGANRATVQPPDFARE